MTSEASDNYVPCDTVAETLVAGIWAELLVTDRVGALDDLFELGGDSLLMTMAIARIEAACGVLLPIGALFPDASVRGVAARLEEMLLAEIESLSDAEAEALLAQDVDQP